MNSQPPLIVISEEIIKRANEFSEKVVDETYDRFKKDKEERKKRIFIGKLGDLVFSEFLNSREKKHETKGMLDIYPGTTNVDPFDFITTKTNETIDVKTAYEDFHTRIMVPFDQFEDGKAKDYYVGIKIDLVLHAAVIFGFTTKAEMGKKKQDFGEGPAYWVYLNELKPIEGLLELFE